ncbi:MULTISPECIES: hypothetical protein [Lentzea]|uniref:Excreted virulence factor EspC, type VII ESX diderm n=1 Tax=Lentzea albida TaxID=65499 RepID=A0A1H9JAF3_9PSEU|nr:MULTISPECIES: hypothetical protein [Lentzea]USX50547.1 hypothetical protein ND450_35015 [Lentzea sp. HUAS12]SEQ83806.1 hypothetical protein SAMN04488000_104524 [Lentzea albida]
MSSLFTDAAEMRAYAEYLRTEAQEFETIRKYVHATACDKAGFTGLLALLQPGVDVVRALFDETLDFGKSKLEGTATAVDATAKTYEDIDALQRRIFEGLLK